MSMTEYWRERFELRDQLLKQYGPVVYIASVAKPLRGTLGGSVVDCTAMLAAQRICDGSHQIATEEQVKQSHQQQQDCAKLVASLERRGAAKRSTITSEVE